jgi:predicted TIM-barrel fold metal-dependent hydrolase
MLDLEETFVLDAVSHAYNLDESNFRNERHASTSAEMVYGIFAEAMPPGTHPTPESYFRDWSIEEVANMLFLESDTDFSTFHPIPINAFYDGMVSTEKAQAAVEQWPERFMSYATIDPLGGEAALDDLEAQVEAFDPIGLKLYPASYGSDYHDSYRMDDPDVAYPVYEKARELGIEIIAAHKALPLGPVPREPYNPADIDEPAKNFPELTFEIVHGGLAFTEETAWQVARYPNVCVNLETFGVLLAGGSEKAARMLGQLLSVGGEMAIDQLFWGSGAMAAHAQPQLEAFRDFSFSDELRRGEGIISELPELTDEHKRKILGENYADLVGLDIEAVQKSIADDEFSQRRAEEGRAPPFSTTEAEIDAGGPA